MDAKVSKVAKDAKDAKVDIQNSATISETINFICKTGRFDREIAI